MGLYSSGVFKDHLNVHEGVKGPLCTNQVPQPKQVLP